MSLILTPLPGIPMVQPGDDLAVVILQALSLAGINLENGDILVLAQKVVSKAEGRLVNLSLVDPSERAQALALQTGKDPRFLELVLQESREILRTRPGTVIVEHRLGFVCANAGIDHSNVVGEDQAEEWVYAAFGPRRVGARSRAGWNPTAAPDWGLVIDSWPGLRMGTAELPSVYPVCPAWWTCGEKDLFGYTLRITQVGAVDELARLPLSSWVRQARDAGGACAWLSIPAQGKLPGRTASPQAGRPVP
jgi:coenzyme F420-0:L-glutamate ligase/coenzyme F420-1:gamma-L-glutamate ligase